MTRLRLLSLALALALLPVARLSAGELDGSMESMEAQHEVAVEADYSFLRRPSDVKHLVELGRLVEAEGNADYTLSKVSFPYTRPEVLSFIEHFAREYRRETGAKLVVTSLTRPSALQPANAHDLSVHPAGMAVDLRVPAGSADRKWFESRLLELERAGAIDVTRERHPPHYHVAVFATKFTALAAQLDSVWAVDSLRRLVAAAEAARDSAAAAARHDRPSGTPLMLAALTALALGVPAARRRHARSRCAPDDA